MKNHPRLNTERLLLRGYELSDATDVKFLAGEKDVAATTLNIPYPYEDGMAEEFINNYYEDYKKGTSLTFAIELSETDTYIGGISLTLDKKHNKAELGYYIGKPYWGKGYATEAARVVIQYAFETLDLNRVFAKYMS